MWVHLVTVLGKNPINVTESFLSVIETTDNIYNPKVIKSTVTVFYTKDPQIKTRILPVLNKIFEIVNFNSYKFYYKLKFVYLHTKELPFNDIRNEKDVIECLKVMGEEIKKRKQIREKKEKYSPLFFFDITSGRKTMSILLYILACVFEATEVFQIIPVNEIPQYNIDYIVERLYHSLNSNFLDIFFNNYKDLFFPNPNSVCKVNLPIIPFKKVKKIIQSIKSRSIENTISSDELSIILDKETINELLKYGYLRKFGNNYKLTNLIEILYEIIK